MSPEKYLTLVKDIILSVVNETERTPVGEPLNPITGAAYLYDEEWKGKRRVGPSSVGYRVRVYWPEDAVWYDGLVCFYDATRGDEKRYLVVYEDNEQEWSRLRTCEIVQWRRQDRPDLQAVEELDGELGFGCASRGGLGIAQQSSTKALCKVCREEHDLGGADVTAPATWICPSCEKQGELQAVGAEKSVEVHRRETNRPTSQRRSTRQTRSSLKDGDGQQSEDSEDGVQESLPGRSEERPAARSNKSSGQTSYPRGSSPCTSVTDKARPPSKPSYAARQGVKRGKDPGAVNKRKGGGSRP